MAAWQVFSKEDFSCSICCEVFKNPVILKCSHSFCNSCLQESWAANWNSRVCPLCRSFSMDPVPNLVLKNLCDSFSNHLELLRKEEELAGEIVPECQMCLLHFERMKLFCQVDQKPICIVCHTMKEHKAHAVCPIREASESVKDKITPMLTSLKTDQTDLVVVKEEYENTLAQIKTQVRFVEKYMPVEFEKLHSFLRAEKENRMKMLKKEEEEKSQAIIQEIAYIDSMLTHISTRISTLETAKEGEDFSLLQNCKETLKSENIKFPVLEPENLIDVSKYLCNMPYKVWKKMENIVKNSHSTLNPNTADL